MDTVMVHPPLTIFQGAVSSALTGEMQTFSVVLAQRCLHDRTQKPQRAATLTSFLQKS